MTAVDESRQIRDGAKMLTRLLRIRVDLHVVAFPDGNPQLEGVDGIETQTRAEQRCFAVDLLHTDVLEIQDINEQLFELPFQLVHLAEPPLDRWRCSARVYCLAATLLSSTTAKTLRARTLPSTLGARQGNHKLGGKPVPLPTL